MEVRISEGLYNRLDKDLDAYDWWCVNSNVGYIATDGIDLVVARLRRNGYPKIAEAVYDVWEEVTNKGQVKA